MSNLAHHCQHAPADQRWYINQNSRHHMIHSIDDIQVTFCLSWFNRLCFFVLLVVVQHMLTIPIVLFTARRNISTRVSAHLSESDSNIFKLVNHFLSLSFKFQFWLVITSDPESRGLRLSSIWSFGVVGAVPMRQSKNHLVPTNRDLRAKTNAVCQSYVVVALLEFL